jgi:hypothetical protein
VSRYQVWRRRLAPVAFAVAMALIARDACTKEHRTHATVVLDMGSGAEARDVRAVDAQVMIGSDVVATFHRQALDGSSLGVAKFEAALPAEDAELQIDVDLGARHVKVARQIHIVEGSTATVPLADAIH